MPCVICFITSMQNKSNSFMPTIITSSNRNKIIHKIPGKLAYNNSDTIVVPNNSNNPNLPVILPSPISPIVPVKPQVENLSFWKKSIIPL